MPPTPYDKAVQLLAARPHFRAELAAKLARRGFPSEEIEEALDRLTREGYLNDRQAAQDFTAARVERAGEGSRRIRFELQRRGASPEAVEEALSSLSSEDDLPAAREAAARWSSHRPPSADPRKETASLARHLERKGFSRRAIVAVLKERPGGDTGEDWTGDGDT